MEDKRIKSENTPDSNFKSSNTLEPDQYKPADEGINNTDVAGVPDYKKAKNNPTHQDEDLSGGGRDPLADL